MATLMNNYAIALLVALVAYVADWASDFVCDWWSPECVKFSNIAWFIYVGVGLLIVGLSVRIYQTKGQIVLGKSLAGLGAETFAKGNIYWNQIRGTTPRPTPADTKTTKKD